MRRYLSQALITLLVLICPLTFSTDRVPDFKTACVVESTLSKKDVVTIAAVSCSGGLSSRILSGALPLQRSSYIPAPSSPPIGWFQLSNHGRASPVSRALIS